MKIKTLYICDRCSYETPNGNELRPITMPLTGNTPTGKRDICAKCASDLAAWWRLPMIRVKS